MEQLRSDSFEAGEWRELETDSDQTEEDDSCQEVTHDSCQEVTSQEEVDELAGEEEQVEFINFLFDYKSLFSRAFIYRWKLNSFVLTRLVNWS